MRRFYHLPKATTTEPLANSEKPQRKSRPPFFSIRNSNKVVIFDFITLREVRAHKNLQTFAKPQSSILRGDRISIQSRDNTGLLRAEPLKDHKAPRGLGR